jgi:uncharacterized protein (DUF2344 family)
MENIPINIQQLIDKQNLQIKTLLESNEKLNQKIDKINKKIKNFDYIYKYNTNVFDTDLHKVEVEMKDVKEDVSQIYYKYISKKGNKRPREENKNDKEN